MLRLPKFRLEEPLSTYAALALLAENESAMVVAGGTDLLPNMKHGLFEPELVVSLQRIEALRGIEVTPEGELSIGPMTPLADVAASAEVQQRHRRAAEGRRCPRLVALYPVPSPLFQFGLVRQSLLPISTIWSKAIPLVLLLRVKAISLRLQRLNK